MSAKPDRFAFVIMPFGPEFDGIYRDLILPALQSVGYEVRRADSFVNQQNILKEIVRSIDTADVIIAELTKMNPNVLYELGIAHGLNKPTVLLTQSIEALPFDLRAYRTIVYSTRYDDIEKLQSPLTEIAKKLQAGDSMIFGNPVSDFAPSMQSRQNAARQLVSEPAEFEGATSVPGDPMDEAPSTLQEHIESTRETVGSLFRTVQALAISQVNFESIKDSATTRTDRVLSTIEADIHRQQESLRSKLLSFWDSWERLIGQIMIASSLGGNDTERREWTEAVAARMEEFQDAFRQAIAAARSARDILNQMTGKRVSLTSTIKVFVNDLDGAIEDFVTGESYAARIYNLLS